jgi:hypothetical protein
MTVPSGYEAVRKTCGSHSDHGIVTCFVQFHTALYTCLVAKSDPLIRIPLRPYWGSRFIQEDINIGA